MVMLAGSARARADAPTNPEVTQHDVLPILLLRCTVCHGTRKQEAGLDLRTRASMLRGGKSGPASVPGKPDESLVVQRVLREEMPPRRRLVEVSVKTMEPGELATLEKWIELGAPVVDEVGGVGRVTVGTNDEPSGATHWSFRPPSRDIVPPAVNAAHRVRNPIDAFVLRKLEAHGLTLSPEADRRTLIRRLTLDLTGLPPTPEAISAFLHDDRPDAYELLVDGLLASPRYGERQGRHWLDVAGYSDSEGKTNQDKLRHENWRYRDYVIRAHNDDKPFDRFLFEQIAGDELAKYEPGKTVDRRAYDNLVATAFLRQGPDGTWAGITAFVPDRLEVISDAIDVFGRGVLGLTLKCARCHDHKFDPVSQGDFYSLSAIFKGAYDEHDWLKPQKPDKGYIGERFLEVVAHASEIPAVSKDGKVRIRALWDRGEPSPTYLLERGNYLRPGRLVEPAVPAVLAAKTRPYRVEVPWPGAKKTGRRLALARWLVDPDHPLTARVAVNRVWMHHFEKGIVTSLGNFGVTGARPTHPELLDWLARSFVESGWRMKALHRLIVTSSTYRQSSALDESVRREDPANRWLGRYPLKRIEAEVVRDSLLFVAGRLADRPFGPPDDVSLRPDGLVTSVAKDELWRRSVYVRQRRTQLPTILEAFDLLPMNPNCLERSTSTVATQALHLLNNAMVQKLSGAFALRIQREAGTDASALVHRAFVRALGRSPTKEELEVTREALDSLIELWLRQNPEEGEPAARLRALENICHALFNSSEFVYVD